MHFPPGARVGSLRAVQQMIAHLSLPMTFSANELITFGAKRVFAFATHGLLNGPAAERIEACALEEVVLANTLPLPPNVQKTTRKVRQLSVGKLLAQVIMCIHTGDSVHNLFDVKKGGSLLA